MRSTVTNIGAGIAVAALLATGAAAEVRKYGEEAGWEIAVNDAMGPGCLIEKHGEGWQVQLGIDAMNADKIGYMAVFARTAMPVAADGSIPVNFEVGGETFHGEAFGEKLSLFRRAEGYHGAWVPVNNPEFVYDLAKKESMTITVEGHDPIEVSLAGTDAAFEAMRACQDAQ